MSVQEQFSTLLGKLEETLPVERAAEDGDLVAGLGDPRQPRKQPAAVRKPKEVEGDPVRLKSRARQIEIGKNTKGYENYLLKYPTYGTPGPVVYQRLVGGT